ncbi:sugar phosphate isomerase/epimerase [Paenibacillaceae bacterium]|nr:sugar phosphate isomerase/epimerase [Paenibacillaceae bacterium]
MSYLSVSTWSLHRLLGPLRWTVWNAETGTHDTVQQEQPERYTLLELPQEAASRGYKALEICHFHFPAVDEAYCAELRQAFESSGISFDTLLLDYGDLTSSDDVRVRRDLELMRQWIEIASRCGARQIRIIAGEADPTDQAALANSGRLLAELAQFAVDKQVRIVTENFKSLTSTGENCLAILERAGNAVGLISDFGNFEEPFKYDELARTAPHSVSVHAKAHYDEEGNPDAAEFNRCLEAVSEAGYRGAYVLIYDGPGDMWEGLERIRVLVAPFADR